MTKYRICVSLLSGLGVTSVVCLLLNIPVANFFLSALFIPGAIVLSILSRSENWDSIPALLGSNFVVYSFVALGAILLRFRNIQAAKLRQIAIWLVFPVTVMSRLVCIPSLNPLFPVGMAELSRQELELQQALPLGMGLNDARAALKAKGIQSYESIESSGSVVFQGPDRKITAAAGDRVLSSRFQTVASRFPCGYDMRVILLFGEDERLKEQYVHRFPICP
jgi:hypothetical protein